MSHITKLVSLDGVEYLKVCHKFRLISRCLSSCKQSDLTFGRSQRPIASQQKWPQHLATSLIGQSRIPALPYHTKSAVLFRQPVRHYSDLPPHQLVALPALSPTMESGSIVSWDKSVGDEIAEGDVLCEVETDKATMGFEATEPGFLAKIIVPAGTKGLPLGSPLCVVVASKDEVAAFENYTPPAGGAAKAPADSQQQQQQQQSSPSPAAGAAKSNLPPHKAITLPALSPTMEMGTIVSWEKKEGDYVKEGDLLAEIETDKATMGFEASEEGYLAKIFVPGGAKNIPLGSVLCVLAENESDASKFASVTAAELGGAAPASTPPPAPAQSAPAASSAPASAPAAAVPVSSSDRIKASPYAKLIAKEKSVDLASVGTASGADGRIVSADVLNAAATGVSKAADAAPGKAATVPPGADYVDLPLSSMRSTIAKRLTQSKQSIPHYYLTVQISMDKVLRVRSELNKQLAGRGVKLSVNDFVIKATAVALGRVPECNSAWYDTYIRQYSRADISVAVATDNGLITPIVFSADAKGLVGINSDVVRLAEKARANKLKPQEFQGGTFTISNLGMFGIESFSAIINPPQACILAVGGAQKILVPAPAAKEGEKEGYATSTVMRATLCSDHRVVDGAVGAKWLAEFKACLEDPYNMLL
ncbi:hypothetical protein BOX15_Mlig000634g1 [Macrostomum lignano]|uniref:Acetyltransferase component of pyruvate dehydrogenase complex n=1 Tax=Macrostomum lignano TaxID=282301 RepID=A0A267F4E4_9PLAT|nr:hypothetical protein BOX15_Mlig000634g1 [Macrostomum lignano]